MGPWDFWAHPVSLGLSESDIEVAKNASKVPPPPEAEHRIKVAAQRAADDLRYAPCGLPYGRPS